MWSQNKPQLKTKAFIKCLNLYLTQYPFHHLGEKSVDRPFLCFVEITWTFELTKRLISWKSLFDTKVVMKIKNVFNITF